MRYQATLDNMTVALFCYWARRDLPKLLDGLDGFTAGTDNDFELDATLSGFEGTQGNVLSFWVHQVDRDTVRVDWEQLFGGRSWADQIDVWLNFRFGVNGEAIAPADESKTTETIATDIEPILPGWASQADWFAWFDWYYAQNFGAVPSKLNHMSERSGRPYGTVKNMHSLYWLDKR